MGARTQWNSLTAGEVGSEDHHYHPAPTYPNSHKGTTTVQVDTTQKQDDGLPGTRASQRQAVLPAPSCRLQLEHHPMPFCPDLGPCSVNKAHEPDAGPCLTIPKPWTFPQPSQPAKDILFLALK